MRLCAVAFAILLVPGVQAKDYGDLESSYQNLKKAVADNDAAQVKKLVTETNAVAKEMIASPAPQDSAEKDAWKKEVDYAREIAAYTEYALYTVAVQATPAEALDLLTMLEQQNPKSKYLDEGYPYYFQVLTQTGGASKITGVAEKALVNFPGNPELLLIVAESALTHRQNDRALSHAQRAVVALNKRPASSTRNTALGEAHYVCGTVYSIKNDYLHADRELRAALPMIAGDQSRSAYALFNLGVANYQLSKITLNRGQLLDGLKFSQQSAAIGSPVQDQARRNVQAMKAEVEKR